jgi:DNA-binding beta-propeller fold protein YncE
MRACLKLWWTVAIGLSLLAPSLRAEFVYVANAFSNNVSAYRIDPATGALRQVAGSPFAGVIEPASVAVDLLGRFVYVANEGPPTCRPTASVTTGPSHPSPGRPSPRG